MKTHALLSSAAVALAAFTTMASAGSYTPASNSNSIYSPAPASGAHDWTGFYVDAYLGRWINPAVGNYFGANFGYLTGGGSLLYGGELGVLHDPSLGGGYSQFTLDGRIAAPISSNAMLFGNLGIGRDSGASNFAEYSIGGQYAFSGTMYVRGELVGQTALSGGLGTTSAIRIGAGWEF